MYKSNAMPSPADLRPLVYRVDLDRRDASLGLFGVPITRLAGCRHI